METGGSRTAGYWRHPLQRPHSRQRDGNVMCKFFAEGRDLLQRPHSRQRDGNPDDTGESLASPAVATASLPATGWKLLLSAFLAFRTLQLQRPHSRQRDGNRAGRAEIHCVLIVLQRPHSRQRDGNCASSSARRCARKVATASLPATGWKLSCSSRSLLSRLRLLQRPHSRQRDGNSFS